MARRPWRPPTEHMVRRPALHPLPLATVPLVSLAVAAAARWNGPAALTIPCLLAAGRGLKLAYRETPGKAEGIMVSRSSAVSIACAVSVVALGAGRRLRSCVGPRAIRRPRTLRSRRRRSRPIRTSRRTSKASRDIAPSDIATAIKYCRVAAAKSRRALYQLGRAYAASQQWPDAVGAYRKAVDKGSTTAMVELGVMFGTGTGVPQDEAQARTLFERAARGRQSARRHQSRGAHRRRRRHPTPGRERCSRKRRRRVRRKRSISSG